MLKDVFQSKVTLVQLILEVYPLSQSQSRQSCCLHPHVTHAHTMRPLSVLCSLQALTIETGLICLVMFILLISLMPLCTIIIWACSNEKGNDYIERALNAEDESRVDSIVAFEETIDKTMHCRRIFQFLLQFFSVILMWVRDEHLSLQPFVQTHRMRTHASTLKYDCSKLH